MVTVIWGSLICLPQPLLHTPVEWEEEMPVEAKITSKVRRMG